MQYRPFEYQTCAQELIISHERIGLFLDMGLGKTVITLSAIRELKFDRWAVGKVLVIAPKKVAESTWQKEASKWDHLEGLRVVSCLGPSAKRKKALAEVADVYVINRENTEWLVGYLGSRWAFDTVVIDESTSFKDHRSKRFKALKTVLPRIRRLIELTGTPDPHGLMDLWSQVYLLDGGKRLGRTISVYRDMYFTPDKRSRTTIFSYAPKEGAEAAIRDAISDICYSMKASDYLELPDLIYDDIPVALDDQARKAYKMLERQAVLNVDEQTITAVNAAALSGKLLQLCSGAVYDEERKVVPVHDCKLDALMEAIERLNGQHVIVCYQFIHERERILSRLSTVSGLRYRVYRDARDMEAWNAGEVDVLLMYPASCGYGLNLQEGGHHIIWYTLTWNLEDYQQANKRLHRQGQTCPVIVHHLIVEDGRDEDVAASLAAKDDAQESLLQSLKVRIQQVKEGR